MQAEIARTNNLLLELIRGRQTDQPTLGEIMGMVKDMQSVSRQPDIASILPSVMSVFKDTMSLARETAGGGGKTDWLDLAGKAIDKIPALVSQIAMSRSNPLGAAKGDDNEMDMQAALIKGVAWLKAKALAGKDPDLQVAFILDNFDDASFYQLGKNLLRMPFEDFGKFDPEITEEPLRGWFERVYNGLKDGLKNDSTDEFATGDTGIESDLAGNEKVSG